MIPCNAIMVFRSDTLDVLQLLRNILQLAKSSVVSKRDTLYTAIRRYDMHFVYLNSRQGLNAGYV